MKSLRTSMNSVRKHFFGSTVGQPPAGQDDERMMVPPAIMCGKSQDDARMRGQDDTQDEMKKKITSFRILL